MRQLGTGTRQRGGFTLLEVLLTVSLVSLAASVSLVGISGLIDAKHLQELKSLPARVDAEARLLAVENGPCELVVLSLQNELQLRSRESGEQLAGWFYPPATKLTIGASDGRVIPRVYFDGEGRSLSYRVLLTHGRDVTEWLIQGDTGWVMRADNEDDEVVQQ